MANVVTGSYNNQQFAPSTLDIAMNKPHVAAEIIRQYSHQFRNTVGLDLALLADEMPVSSETHSVFQEGRYWNKAIVNDAGGVTQSAPGGSQTFIIAVDDNNAFFPKVGHTVIYSGANNISGSITAVDTTTPALPTITVQAAAGVTLPAMVDEQELIINSSAWGEGTNQPKPSVKNYERIDAHFQIIKDTVGWTGTQLTNKAWVDISEYGGKFNWYNVGMADIDARQYRLEEGALLLGGGGIYTVNENTGLVDNEHGTTFRETMGMIPRIRQSGGVDSTVTAANWVITDLDDIHNYMTAQGDSSPVIMGWVGSRLGSRISGQLGTLSTYTKDGQSLSQYIGGWGYDDAEVKSRAVNMSYMEYQDINRTYAFRNVWSFSDTMGYGADGYNFNQYGIWFPLTNVTDGKTKAKLPLVSVMYKELDGYSRRREGFGLQGAGGNPETYNIETDVKKFFMRSHIGLAFHKPNLGYITTAGD